MGKQESSNPEMADYSHYQPEPFIIRNGSNFHASLSHEGLFPETYGSNKLIQLIDLDQNLCFEELPLNAGEIFLADDLEWEGEEQVKTQKKCIFLSAEKHDLYGRIIYSITYIDMERWEKIKANTIAEIFKDYRFSHKDVVPQAGKIMMPFRNDWEQLHPTGEIFGFDGRNFILELEQYHESELKKMQKEQVKKHTMERKAQEEKKQTGLLAFC
jgi:hypothetical protein